MKPKTRLLVTIFLGWAGIHRFLDHKIVTGILYLCTFGLCGIGWIVDIIRAIPPVMQKPPKKRGSSYVYSTSATIERPPVPAKKQSGIVSTARNIRSKKDLAAIRSYVVLDTETTGLSRQNDKIVEIALICYDDGVETERFQTLINPGIPIPASATRINHITDDDVADAPTIEAVIPTILRLIGNRVVVGHNIAFDLGFLGYAIAPTPEPIYIDYINTVTLARRAFPGRSSYKLVDLVSALGIADSQDHRALGDVELTAQLFEVCRNTITYK